MNTLSASQETKFLASLTDLIEIADSFDQLKKLADMVNFLYPSSDPVYEVLFARFEVTARHLAGARNIGKEVSLNEK